MSKPRAALLPLFLALITAAPSVVLAADLRVDQLELLTQGDASSGAFKVGSRLYFDLSMEGGDKFAGLLRMDFSNGDIEQALSLANTNQDPTSPTLGADLTNRITNLTSPRLRTVAVTARSFFGLPFDLAYFIGSMDTFASGDDFTPLFGAAPFATELRGPMVYPKGVGGNQNIWFDGIYAANGTGFRLSTTPKISDSSIGYLYLYQDSNADATGTGGIWSGDLRYLINSPGAKAELFAGATTQGSLGAYRGGLLFYAGTGDVGEFFAQAGVTHWDPASQFSIDDLYFLFEPRLNLGIAQVAITVFKHPSWYLQQYYGDQGEKGALDAAFNLRFGRISQNGAQGGAETLFSFRQYLTTTFSSPVLSVDTAAYYSLIAGGVRWDFKLNLHVFPFPSQWYGMLNPFIGLKTSY